MAAALAAVHLRIPVLHVEAGLRAGRKSSKRRITAATRSVSWAWPSPTHSFASVSISAGARTSATIR